MRGGVSPTVYPIYVGVETQLVRLVTGELYRSPEPRQAAYFHPRCSPGDTGEARPSAAVPGRAKGNGSSQAQTSHRGNG